MYRRALVCVHIKGIVMKIGWREYILLFMLFIYDAVGRLLNSIGTRPILESFIECVMAGVLGLASYQAHKSINSITILCKPYGFGLIATLAAILLTMNWSKHLEGGLGTFKMIASIILWTLVIWWFLWPVKTSRDKPN